MNTENKRLLELEALQLAVESIGLTNYKIHSNNKGKYLFVDNTGTSLTGWWKYTELNHFIMGFGKAMKNLTTPQKRFKILFTLLQELNIATDEQYSPLCDKMEELANKIDEDHPQAMEALCYYEDNILAILSDGMEVKELN